LSLILKRGGGDELVSKKSFVMDIRGESECRESPLLSLESHCTAWIWFRWAIKLIILQVPGEGVAAGLNSLNLEACTKSLFIIHDSFKWAFVLKPASSWMACLTITVAQPLCEGANKIASCFNPGFKVNIEGILIHFRRDVCSICVGYVGHHAIEHFELSESETLKIILCKMNVAVYEKGHAVAYLVEELRYKPEGCGFYSRWGHLIFSIYQILPAAL
jgi:hypothetical protein